MATEEDEEEDEEKDEEENEEENARPRRVRGLQRV